MAFSSDELTAIQGILDDWCERKVPIMVRDQCVLQYRASRHDLLLFEKRMCPESPSGWMELPIAKFRFNRRRRHWTLLWQDRNLDWHIYGGVEPTADLARLLDEVDRDPIHIFWG